MATSAGAPIFLFSITTNFAGRPADGSIRL